MAYEDGINNLMHSGFDYEHVVNGTNRDGSTFRLKGTPKQPDAAAGGNGFTALPQGDAQGPTVANAPAAQPAAISSAMAPQVQPGGLQAIPRYIRQAGEGLAAGARAIWSGDMGVTPPQVGLSRAAKQIAFMNPSAVTPQAIAAASQPDSNSPFAGMEPATGERFTPVPFTVEPAVPGATIADLMAQGPQMPIAAEFAQSAANMRGQFSPEAEARMAAASDRAGMTPGTANYLRAHLGRGTPKEQQATAQELANMEAATLTAKTNEQTMARNAQNIAGRQTLAETQGATAENVAQIHADAAAAGLALSNETAIAVAEAKAKRETDPRAALGSLYKAYAEAMDDKTKEYLQGQIDAIRGGGAAPTAQVPAQIKAYKGRKYQLKPGGNVATQADWQDIGAA